MTRRVRVTALLGALVVIGVAALGWQFIVSPRLDAARSINEQADQVELANIRNLTRYADLQKKAEELPRAARDVKRLFASMPREADLPSVLQQVTRAAGSAGIPPDDITSLTAGLPEPVEGSDDSASVRLATMSLAISVKGDEAEFRRFLQRLIDLDRSLLITSTGMTLATGGGQDSTLTVNGTLFVLQSQLDDLLEEVRRLVDQLDGVTGGGTGP